MRDVGEHVRDYLSAYARRDDEGTVLLRGLQELWTAKVQVAVAVFEDEVRNDAKLGRMCHGMQGSGRLELANPLLSSSHRDRVRWTEGQEAEYVHGFHVRI